MRIKNNKEKNFFFDIKTFRLKNLKLKLRNNSFKFSLRRDNSFDSKFDNHAHVDVDKCFLHHFIRHIINDYLYAKKFKR